MNTLYDKEQNFMDLFNTKLKKFLTHCECYGMNIKTTNTYVEFPLWITQKTPLLCRLQFLFRVAYMYEEGLYLIHYTNTATDYFGNKLELTDDELQLCHITKTMYEFAISELERIINRTPQTPPFIHKGSGVWVYSSWFDNDEDGR